MYSVSGQIVFGSVPVSGVLISTSSGFTTTTGAYGNFTLPVFENTITFTPSKLGYVFTPASRTLTVNGVIANVNFAAMTLGYSISGRVLEATNPISSVTIFAGTSYSATTGTDGNYALTGLVTGTYTLTATKPGFVFATQTVIVPPDRTDINFTRDVAQVIWPRGMVSDPTTNRLFVADALDSATVSVFNEAAGALIKQTSLSLTQSPAYGVGTMNNLLYVANWGTNTVVSTVSVIDLATLTKLKDIPINKCGRHASHLVVNPITGRVYVAMHSWNQVAMIDTLNNDAVTCLITNAAPYGLAFHATSNSIFVGNRDGLDLWRISGATSIATQVVDWRIGLGGGSPYHISVSPATDRLLAMVGLPNSDVPDKLFVYDIAANGALTQVAGTPVTVGNTNDGGSVWQSQSACPSAPNLIFIAATNDSTVWILNSDLTLRRVLTVADGIGELPFSMTENPTLKQIYLGNTWSNTINILNACDGSVIR